MLADTLTFSCLNEALIPLRNELTLSTTVEATALPDSEFCLVTVLATSTALGRSLGVPSSALGAAVLGLPTVVQSVPFPLLRAILRLGRDLGLDVTDGVTDGVCFDRTSNDQAT